jgi:hypothetical protein
MVAGFGAPPPFPLKVTVNCCTQSALTVTSVVGMVNVVDGLVGLVRVTVPEVTVHLSKR